MSANQIMVVDDEVGIRELCSRFSATKATGAAGRERADGAQPAREMRPDLVLLDIWMPDTDGITLLKEWRDGPAHDAGGDDVRHGTIDSAVEATRIGAFDFLEKPISLPKLLATVARHWPEAARCPAPASP